MQQKQIIVAPISMYHTTLCMANIFREILEPAWKCHLSAICADPCRALVFTIIGEVNIKAIINDLTHSLVLQAPGFSM